MAKYERLTDDSLKALFEGGDNEDWRSGRFYVQSYFNPSTKHIKGPLSEPAAGSDENHEKGVGGFMGYKEYALNK